MERSNVFVQTSPILFQDAPESEPPKTLTPADIYVRRERQTFSRLEKSQAVLFTVRTYMKPLQKLELDELTGLASQIRGWEPALARYKGIDVWGDVALKWCDERLQCTTDAGEQ